MEKTSHGIVLQALTREFKLVAVQQLEQGISIAEVARALEVNPNVLHRWRKEFGQGPGDVFPGHPKSPRTSLAAVTLNGSPCR